MNKSHHLSVLAEKGLSISLQSCGGWVQVPFGLQYSVKDNQCPFSGVSLCVSFIRVELWTMWEDTWRRISIWIQFKIVWTGVSQSILFLRCRSLVCTSAKPGAAPILLYLISLKTSPWRGRLFHFFFAWLLLFPLVLQSSTHPLVALQTAAPALLCEHRRLIRMEVARLNPVHKVQTYVFTRTFTSEKSMNRIADKKLPVWRLFKCCFLFYGM